MDDPPIPEVVLDALLTAAGVESSRHFLTVELFSPRPVSSRLLSLRMDFDFVSLGLCFSRWPSNRHRVDTDGGQSIAHRAAPSLELNDGQLARRARSAATLHRRAAWRGVAKRGVDGWEGRDDCRAARRVVWCAMGWGSAADVTQIGEQFAAVPCGVWR